MLRLCTRCQLVSRDLMQSPAVACREIEQPSSSAVRAAEKPCSPCRHWSMGRRAKRRRGSRPFMPASRYFTLDRPARRGLFPRGERPALGTRRLPRQEEKGVTETWVSVQEGRLRRFGLSRGNTDPGFAGWGFLLRDRVLVEPVLVNRTPAFQVRPLTSTQFASRFENKRCRIRLQRVLRLVGYLTFGCLRNPAIFV